MRRTVLTASGATMEWGIPKPNRSRQPQTIKAFYDVFGRSLGNLGDRIEKIGRWVVGYSALHFPGTLMMLPRVVELNHVRPTIRDNVFVAPTAMIAGNVAIGRKSYIGYQVTIRADKDQKIVVGESANVQEKAVVFGNSTIGKWATVEPMAVIDNADIAACAFVGQAAIVMRGAIIESGAMLCNCSVLQAGAVIPSGEVWAGNPAQKVGLLEDEEKKQIIKAAKHLVLIGVRHRDSWERTWTELEGIRLSREGMKQINEMYNESRMAPLYIRQPPNRTKRTPLAPTPYDVHQTKGKVRHAPQGHVQTSTLTPTATKA